MMNAAAGSSRLSGGRGQWLDPYLRETPLSADKRRAWFEDQYRHPHESTHTIGEVLEWFKRTDWSSFAACRRRRAGPISKAGC